VRGSLASFSDFFVGFFFVILGVIVPLPGIGPLAESSLFAILLIVSTLFVVTILAEYAGLNTRQSLQTALLLTQTSEFSLILVLKGHLIGILSQEVFAMVVFLTVATMTLTPLLNREGVVSWLMKRHPTARMRYSGSRPEGAVILVAFEPPADYLLQSILETRRPIVVLSEDAALVRSLCHQEIVARQYETLDRETLEKSGLSSAIALICVPAQWSDSLALLKITEGYTPVAPMIPVLDEAQARIVQERGGKSVDFTGRTQENLIQWCRQLSCNTVQSNSS
jgi:hypothetical protein